MKSPTKFLVIDDDAINNLICKRIINIALGDHEIQTFTNPESGFTFIETEYSGINDDHGILLLDINMPVMTGWEFLDRFQNLADKIKNRISVYIVSSSIDQRDIERAAANKLIKDFLVKPITTESILRIANPGIYVEEE